MDVLINIAATILALITVFGIPVTLTILVIVFYRKTKKQEVEIAVLKERLKHYEKPTDSDEHCQRWKAEREKQEP